MVEAEEQPLGPGLVGFGLGRVLADGVDRPDLAVIHALEHLGQVATVLRFERHAPGFFELAPDRVVLGPVLKPRQAVGDRSHVAAALHVVLAPERIEPRSPPAHVAGEERQVAEREDVVHGVVVLGDA